MKELKPLPVSTSTFHDIIKGGFLYVDKTEHIYKLVKPPKGAYFLSRPRRFGKSLVLSTLEQIFLGNRELFEKLWIDNSDYSWKEHPVIRFDFSLNQVNNADQLAKVIDYHIQRIARKRGLELFGFDYQTRFQDLIDQLAQQNQVVVLIDEYDKPLLDNITNVAEVEQIRNVLKGFYTILKGMENSIRMVFITGVSKFSKVSIFSELNNLKDITIDERFGSLCGITQGELNHHFHDYLPRFAEKENITVEQLLERIRHWYNGFRFTRIDESLYNPYSTMLLFDGFSFHNFWFESGTPTFLIDLMHKDNYDVQQLGKLQVQEIFFSSYDIKSIAILPLLFQTGYLTIKDYNPKEQLYTLYYPNYEVENSFIIYLLDFFSNIEQGLSASHLWRLIHALRIHDLHEFFRVLKVFYANIDYQLHIKQEKYYQNIFYLLFTLMGLYIQAEVQKNDGRIDAVAEVEDHIYIFEFKLNKDAQKALDQIKTKNYAQKYALHSKPITKIGVNFDSRTGQADDWKVAE